MATAMQAITKGGEYRPDIQIFRGIAVLAVLLFHLGLPGFNSGFLGVDIFFVISGYLMQHLYGGGITARDFYNRRARRILPAYYGVLIAIIGAGFFVILPGDFQDSVNQAIYAAILAANIGHWTLNPYFAGLDFTPLLHLWSLGVEVQFYLFFPLVLIITRRFPALLIAGLAASLLLCLAMDFVSPKTSFYWLPTRFWEFAIGMCAARWPASQPRPTLGLLAAALLVLSLFIPVDGSALNPVNGHPGLVAFLAACLTGTALRFGLPNSVTSSPVGQIGQRIGDISYSLYLAHFPVIVLMHYRPYSGTLTKTTGPVDLVATVAVIAVATALTYYGLERNSPKLWKPRAWAAVAVATIAASLVLPGLQLRMMDPIDRNITSAKADRGVERCGRFFAIAHPFEHFCALNAGATPVMLIGDSHADALKSAFVKAATDQGYSVLLPVSRDLLSTPKWTAEWLKQQADARGIRIMFLHFSRRSLTPEELERFRRVFANSGIQLIYVRDVPLYDERVPRTLWEERHKGRVPKRQTLAENEALDAPLRIYLAQHPEFTVVEPARVLCTPVCAISDAAGRPYYVDADHLTLTGARQLDASIADAFGRIKVAEPGGADAEPSR